MARHQGSYYGTALKLSIERCGMLMVNLDGVALVCA